MFLGEETQVGKNHSPKKKNRDWIGALLNSSSGYCDDHRDLRSNEKNTFCVDCGVRLCRHCKDAHSIHKRFQIYRYSYQDVFRHCDLHKHFDCSDIQTYISNNERIVHLKPRPPIYKSKVGDQVLYYILKLYMETIQDLLDPANDNIAIAEDPKTGDVSLPGD